MLTGKHFRLRVPTLGILTVEDNREAVLVPAQEIVEVTSGPHPDDKRMVDVRWRDKQILPG